MLRVGRGIASKAIQGLKFALTESSPASKTTPLSDTIATLWKQSTTRSQWTDSRGYTHFRKRGLIFSPRGSRNPHDNPHRQRRTASLLIILTAGGTVVYISSRQEIPYTKRKHAIMVDIDTERELGLEAFQQVVAEARATRTLLPSNHPASQAVARVGSRIAAVAGDGYGGGFVEHMKGLKWEFAVVKSPQVNAFVVPGGKVVVYTGLLQMLQSEDELAAVLAHEVAHIVARHAAERITQGSIIELFRFLAYIVLGIPIPGGAVAAAFFLPNSRKAETEADAIGIQLAARSCYDPSAAAIVFSKLGEAEKKMGGASMPKLLRTHPVTSERIKAINKMLETAQNLYVQSGCEDKVGLLAEFQDTLGARIRRIDWTRVWKSV